MGDLSDGAAGDARHYHRQPGDHHRHVFNDPPGHAARLVSRRAHPADLGPGIRSDLRAVRELDHHGLHNRADHRLHELEPAGRRLWHRGVHHDATHDGPALPRHARAPTSPSALAVGGIFVLVDFTLFAANLAKIRDGGWVPLTFGALVFATMATWRYGMDALQARHTAASMSPEVFFEKLRKLKIPRVPGTAVFLTRMADSTPPLLVRHVEQIGALQESVVALTVKFADVPRIPRADRLEVRKLADNFWQITAHFGFVQVPDLPAALRQAKASGCE